MNIFKLSNNFIHCIKPIYFIYVSDTFLKMYIEYNVFLSVFHITVLEAIQLNKRLSALNKKQESEICSLKKV